MFDRKNRKCVKGLVGTPYKGRKRARTKQEESRQAAEIITSSSEKGCAIDGNPSKKTFDDLLRDVKHRKVVQQARFANYSLVTVSYDQNCAEKAQQQQIYSTCNVKWASDNNIFISKILEKRPFLDKHWLCVQIVENLCQPPKTLFTEVLGEKVLKKRSTPYFRKYQKLLYREWGGHSRELACTVPRSKYSKNMCGDFQMEFLENVQKIDELCGVFSPAHPLSIYKSYIVQLTEDLMPLFIITEKTLNFECCLRYVN